MDRFQHHHHHIDLPIAGLLVQAPHESNKAWQTILALSGWVGSPIATLSYILWKIKVTGEVRLDD